MQKGSLGIWLGIIIILLIIAGGVIWGVLQINATTPPPIAQTGQPSMKVTDYSQGVRDSQKTAVVVEHSDSAYEKFLLSNTMVDNFVQHLPQGDKVVSKTPLGK